ncbi:MAG: SIS domain-containing protein [Spirochaetales bacterium]|nr:SIS domain-containing protein [Spirochaetales bacterium]
MNLQEDRYARFKLVQEMMETPSVVARFDPAGVTPFLEAARARGGLFLTGEGSSRLFPAKSAIAAGLRRGLPIPVLSETCTQALEYELTRFAVFAASNSGKTREVVRLFRKLGDQSHEARFALTVFPDSPLAGLATEKLILGCGPESAVAATKSVVEQALVYDALLRELGGARLQGTNELAQAMQSVLTAPVGREIVEPLLAAPTIYFVGRNDGVAEELTLKTYEITRKKALFLEGTFALHGIEEIMDAPEALVLVEPFPEEEATFHRRFVQELKLPVVAVASRPTAFPTLRLPSSLEHAPYLQLAAGWTILVEIGVALGLDLDHPRRARKIGNEYTGEGA